MTRSQGPCTRFASTWITATLRVIVASWTLAACGSAPHLDHSTADPSSSNLDVAVARPVVSASPDASGPAVSTDAVRGCESALERAADLPPGEAANEILAQCGQVFRRRGCRNA